MNTKQLHEKLYRVDKISYGTWRVTVQHKRRKKYILGYGWEYGYRYTEHITHNAAAIDRLSDVSFVSDYKSIQGYTYKQALKALINY